MAFPITHIKATSVELTDELRTLVEEKFDAFKKFIDESETDVTCDVELEKTTNQQSGNIFRAEVNLFWRGKLYRAEATTDQLSKSVDEVKDEVLKELRRTQKKSQSLVRRGGAALKRMMRFGNEG